MGKTYPLVSVVITNYNGKHFLKDCLDSLLKMQCPSEKPEIIVVDNGSKDGSLGFLRKKYPSVNVLKSSVNNYARANNLGIKAAKGEFIALANNDLIFDRAWLKELLKVTTSGDKVGAVIGKILFPDGKLQGTGHYDLPNFYWSDRGFREEDVGQYDMVEEMGSISHCAVLYRRSCLQDVGPLDEDFNMYVEDVDMAIRAQQKGWKLLYTPKGRVYHKFHGTATEDRVGFFCERNRLLLVAKHFPSKLPEALFGRGYFTALNNRNDFFKVLPEITRKLIATCDAKTASALWPSFFESLGKISNIERDHVVGQLDALKKTLSEKSELLSQRDQWLSQQEQALQVEKNRAEEFRRKIEAGERVLLEAEKISQAKFDEANKVREKEVKHFQNELEKQLREIEAQSGKLAQHDLIEKEFRAQTALWESNLASQQALLEREKKSNKALEDALWASDGETGRLRTELEEKNKELEKQLREIEAQAGKLAHYDLLEKEFRSQQSLWESSLVSQQALLAEEKSARKDSENMLRVREEELGRYRTELEIKNQELGDRWREIEGKNRELGEQWRVIESKNQELGDRWREIEGKNRELGEQWRVIESKNQELGDRWREIEGKNRELGEQWRVIESKNQELGDRWREIEEKNQELEDRRRELESKNRELDDQGRELEARAGRLEQYEQLTWDLRAELETKSQKIEDMSQTLEAKNQELGDHQRELEAKNNEIGEQRQEMEENAGKLAQYEQLERDLRAKQVSLEHTIKAGNEALEHYKAESTAKSEQIETLHQNLVQMTGNRDALQKEVSSFYASRTFRYIVGPAWKVLDRLKQWRRALFSFGKRPPKSKEEKKRQTLFIKPQRVSIDQMEKSIRSFKVKEPNVKVSLLANLTAEDHACVSSERFGFIDERLLYTPKSKKFCFQTQRELLKDLRRRRLDRAIVLKGERDYAGYQKAWFFASLVGAKVVKELEVYDRVPGISKFQMMARAWKESLQQSPRTLANLVMLAGVLVFFLVFIVGDMKIRKYMRRFQKG